MDMCSQVDVIGHRGELQSSTEVALSGVIVAGVMGHPTGHLRKCSGGAKSVPAAV
jgi:hypothetical protein